MHYEISGILTNDEFVLNQNLLLRVENFEKFLLQYIAICNRISANLLHIAICNKWYLIALHIYCNSPVIYCQWSDQDRQIRKKVSMITHNCDLIGNDRQSRSDTPNSGSNYRYVLLVCTYTLHNT